MSRASLLEAAANQVTARTCDAGNSWPGPSMIPNATTIDDSDSIQADENWTCRVHASTYSQPARKMELNQVASGSRISGAVSGTHTVLKSKRQ